MAIFFTRPPTEAVTILPTGLVFMSILNIRPSLPRLKLVVLTTREFASAALAVGFLEADFALRAIGLSPVMLDTETIKPATGEQFVSKITPKQYIYLKKVDPI